MQKFSILVVQDVGSAICRTIISKKLKLRITLAFSCLTTVLKFLTYSGEMKIKLSQITIKKFEPSFTVLNNLF